MAIDLNATPKEEAEQVLDLNKAPGEQDVHDSFELAVRAGEDHEAQTLPRVSLEATSLGDEQVEATSLGDEQDVHGQTEEQNDVQGKHIWFSPKLSLHLF
jgi:hypothetical protein